MEKLRALGDMYKRAWGLAIIPWFCELSTSLGLDTYVDVHPVAVLFKFVGSVPHSTYGSAPIPCGV